jgi:hypothetical protein
LIDHCVDVAIHLTPMAIVTDHIIKSNE